MPRDGFLLPQRKQSRMINLCGRRDASTSAGPATTSHEGGNMAKRTVRERFWAKVQKTDTCWLWTGGLDRDGYGVCSVDGRTRRAHRVAYEWLVGAIPDGLVIDHLCRTPPCVNPAHMEPVTNAENVLRGVNGSAQNARKTHCIHGHPFDEANTLVEQRPSTTGRVRWRRVCRACKRETKREMARAVALLAVNPKGRE